MHIFTSHLYQLHELHGDLNRFSCQQLEFKNHWNAKNFFQSTNQHTNLSENDDFLIQLLNKNNRIEYFRKNYENKLSKNKTKKRIFFRTPKFCPNFRVNRY